MLTYDVAIVGSGIVGAVTALTIARETNLKIAVIDSKNLSSDNVKHTRVSAISLASKAIFQNLGVWSNIPSDGVSAYTKMHVWDAGSKGVLDFDARLLGEYALGYIIPDDLIKAALLEKIQELIDIDFLAPIYLVGLKENRDNIELVTDTGKIIRTQLLIGADGAHSWVRKQAGIGIDNQDYGHIAIVTTIESELSHQMTAWQRFLPTGPLAFLPLKNNYQSSIVWSVKHAEAEHLLGLDDILFCEALEQAFEKKLGKLRLISERFSFKLEMRHAKKYVQSRIALAGDAVHTLHPLAGQGVNLGLLDAVSLAEIIIEAHKKNRDFFSFENLRRYERGRKGDILTMLSLVKNLSMLFGNNKKIISQMRGFGLELTNQSDFLKKMLMEYAVGKRSDLPMICK